MPPGQHSDLWDIVFALRHKLHAVTWVKAHLTLAEALGRGISADDWRLNHQADLATTRGMNMHIEDPRALILFQHRSRIVKLWQAHLVRLYMRYRTLPKFRGIVAPGLHARTRPSGPPHLPRRLRTDLRWQAQHHITHCDQGDACTRCGRISRARRQGRLQQWRRRCVPLQVHARRLHMGILPYGRGFGGVRFAPALGTSFTSAGATPSSDPDPMLCPPTRAPTTVRTTPVIPRGPKGPAPPARLLPARPLGPRVP